MGSRTRIRVVRWVSQIAFLAVWLFLTTGAVCTATLGSGLAVSEPVGVLQLILAQGAAGRALSGLSMTLLVGLTLFVGVTLLLGRAFCAWSCPLGTAIDLIDAALRKLKIKPFLSPRKEGKDKPPGIVRNEINKYAVLASALTGSALFRSPVWCSLCPIGTLCRGAIAGAEVSIGAELLTVPAVGAMSLGEKRLWCRYLCPVGGFLTIVSKLNPFLKPKVQNDASHQNCGACTTLCPEGINICQEKSFARCTKCFDCYAKCPFGAVRIAFL
jgi:ferredoxin-type protein NapH